MLGKFAFSGVEKIDWLDVSLAKMANENNKENLKIVNFAGIKSLDIDLANLTLLLGPQAVGKSIVLKLVFFFRSLRDYIVEFYSGILGKYSLDELETYLLEINQDKELRSYLSQKFLDIFPMGCYQESCNEQTVISYDSGNLQKWTVKIDCENGRALLNEESGLFKKIKQCVIDAKETFESEQNSLPNNSDENIPFYPNKKTPLSIFEENFKKFLPQEFNIFIPAGRSFFAIVNNNIWHNVSDQKTFSLDPIFMDFGRWYSFFQRLYTEKEFSSGLIEDVLGVVYIRKGNRDYIQHQDRRRVPLHLASSGQQELIPLAIILEVLCFSSSIRPINIYIEEPEAHLFPEAQKETAYAIANVLNQLMEKRNVKIFLSSHSPYIMTSFNNLLQAGQIISEAPEKSDSVEKIVPEGAALQPNVTAAYFLDGESESIITRNGLINAKKIDSVSYTIMEDYNQLMRLKIGT